MKYPRTPHLPSSPGGTNDDKRMSVSAADALFSRQIVVTEKMDGGNVTLAREYFHARSTSDNTPLWERYAKAEWAKIAHDIPEGWRVSAESLWARRSVAYDNLSGFLLVIGVWDETNTLLSWRRTEEWAALLGLPTVPVLGNGCGSERAALAVWKGEACNLVGEPCPAHDAATSEGFVVRTVYDIRYADFDQHVGKWVRPDHVQTTAQWRKTTHFPTNRALGIAQIVP